MLEDRAVSQGYNICRTALGEVCWAAGLSYWVCGEARILVELHVEDISRAATGGGLLGYRSVVLDVWRGQVSILEDICGAAA